MRNFRDSAAADGGTGSPVRDLKDPTVKSAEKPSLYRTLIAIAVVAITIMVLIIVASRSGSYHPAGGLFPRTVFITIDNLSMETVSFAVEGNKAPNLRFINETGGALGSCVAADSSSPLSRFVSVITGTSPDVHGVRNLTADGFSSPSIMRIGTLAQLNPAAIGPASVFSGTTGDKATGKCDRVGVLDMECFGQTCPNAEGNCNSASKSVVCSDSSSDDVIGSAADAIESGSELIHIHLENVPVITSNDGNSVLRQLSQVYLADSQIGRVFQVLVDRTFKETSESWMLVIAGTGARAQDSSLLSVSTIVRGQPQVMAPLTPSASVIDAVPTILKWMDVRPDDKDAAQITGVPQGICSNGVSPPASC